MMIKMLRRLLGKPETVAALPIDFSSIDSREKVLAAAQEGVLFPILLFPKIFGGDESEANTVYVPAGIPEVQNQIVATMARFVEQELVDNLRVEPQYKDSSFVPSTIRMYTSKSQAPGQFNPTIEIW